MTPGRAHGSCPWPQGGTRPGTPQPRPGDGSPGLNAAQVQFTCDTDPSRAWYLVPEADTASYFLRNKYSGRSLAVTEASTGSSGQSVQFTCDANPSRRWVPASLTA